MTSPSRDSLDLVIRGGTVVCGGDVVRADIGIADGRIAALGRHLAPARDEIDAAGLIALPGGVDVHAHIEQISATGLETADDWASATTAAALGGTTTVLAFAAQHRGQSLAEVTEDYARRAAAGAVIDYGFHLMVGNPDARTLQHDLPALIAAGHRSVKVFMTYDRLALSDEQLLDVMCVARDHGALVCVHAENHGMIAWKTRQLLAAGHTAPRHHAEAHVRLAESDAIRRVIDLARLSGATASIFHVSTREGVAAIRKARAAGQIVHAETCPQYLFLTDSCLDRPGLEGAKWMFSPPPRTGDDQEALWLALRLGDLQIVSSDHAPYRHDATGKLRAGPDAAFNQIANGVPGIGHRQALMFDALAAAGNAGLVQFADITATRPARIYGLSPAKGSIAIGADADIALWDPDRDVTFDDDLLTGQVGYSPYAGTHVRGWPVTTLRRGLVIARDGALLAAPGSGQQAERRRSGPQDAAR